MVGALIWMGAGLAIAAVAAFAGRRFAASVRASGGSLLTDKERRELFYNQPLGSFPKIVADDLAGFDQLLRRQVDSSAERWRRVTLGAFAAFLVVLAFPILARGVVRGSGAPSGDVGWQLFSGVALIIAAFCAIQLWYGIVRRRSAAWLIICSIGVVAGLVVAVVVPKWLG